MLGEIGGGIVCVWRRDDRVSRLPIRGLTCLLLRTGMHDACGREALANGEKLLPAHPSDIINSWA